MYGNNTCTCTCIGKIHIFDIFSKSYDQILIGVEACYAWPQGILKQMTDYYNDPYGKDIDKNFAQLGDMATLDARRSKWDV